MQSLQEIALIHTPTSSISEISEDSNAWSIESTMLDYSRHGMNWQMCDTRHFEEERLRVYSCNYPMA